MEAEILPSRVRRVSQPRLKEGKSRRNLPLGRAQSASKERCPTVIESLLEPRVDAWMDERLIRDAQDAQDDWMMRGMIQSPARVISRGPFAHLFVGPNFKPNESSES